MKKRLMAIALTMAFASLTATAGELGTGNRTCNQNQTPLEATTPCNNFDATNVTLTQIITAICSIVS